MNITPYFSVKPWGGKFLSEKYLIKTDDKIGEAFLVSTLNHHESTLNGQTLSHFLGRKLSYLIKIIDAEDNLSIQVHPDDDWAEKLEKSKGKSECWLVIDHKKDAKIYVGLKQGKTLESLFQSIRSGTFLPEDFLNEFKVSTYDFFDIPAGTIHAIGAGVKIMEFQQSSGITYRIWDWNREGRELHVEKAEQVSKSEIQIKTTNWNKIKDGEIFFSHHDFSLIKADSTTIKCDVFNISLLDFSIRMI